MPLMPPELLAEIDWPKVIEMPYHHDCLYDMLLREEPWPHLVYYRGGRVNYVSPDKFRMHTEPKIPSDCTWIVPGTGQ